MPWKEQNKVEQRCKFVNESKRGQLSHTELCKKYGVSRKTGYKWLGRFNHGGYPALEDTSKRPHSNSKQLSEEEIIEIIMLKNAYPNWGAKKIAQLMRNASKVREIPSISSINRVLNKAGLVKKKKRKKVDTSKNTLRNLIKPKEPNDVWTVDFKGWWLGKNKNRINPLTIRDEKSRFLLGASLLEKQTGGLVKEVFQDIFKRHGLPKVIRSDNGSPFASNNSILGLTKLSAWWISFGVIPDRIEPGKPYQNGGHERLHRDIAKEIQPFHRNETKLVQAALDNWRNEFNTIRPHEALDMKTPFEVYSKSPRPYTGDIEEIVYPLGFERRKVSNNGNIKIRGIEIFLSRALTGYHVGLEHTDNNVSLVWFNNFHLGHLDLSLYKFYPREKSS